MITQGNNPRRGLVEKAAPSIGGDYAEGNEVIDAAKVHNPKDLCKILDYFRYTTGSTLDAALATGILRNSITWYVAYLEAPQYPSLFGKEDLL